MLPALPLPNVVVDTALPEMDITSLAVTFMSPALPEPTAGCPVAKLTRPLVLLMDAPSFRKSEPTFALIWPALPAQPVELSISAPALAVNTGAVIDTVPPVPCVGSVAGTKPLPADPPLAASFATACTQSTGAGAAE